MIRLISALIVLILAAGASGRAQRVQRGEVLVSAASSLTDVLQDVARAYEATGAERIVLNLAASNTLARQITSGARVDLFISADAAQMDAVREQIVPGTRTDLISNQLAIAVAGDSRTPVRSARDLASPSIRRIAIGDPAAVPAGVYARSYLTSIGLWPQVEPKVVPAASVRLALAAVENGAADAAIVYRTDVGTARRARTALVIPEAEGPRIVYPAAVIRGGHNTAGAARVLAYLKGDAAAAVFTRAGFLRVR